jgi:energy-coupling factor transport system substrate-specific component
VDKQELPIRRVPLDGVGDPLPSEYGDLQETMLLALGGLCVALNVGLGALISLMKLPIYLDAVGTIEMALLVSGRRWRGFALAALVGAASSLVSGILVNPVLFWFAPTQVAIAAYSFLSAPRLIKLSSPDRPLHARNFAEIIVFGVGLGLVAAIISAPIVVFVFGGVTGAGDSILVAFLIRSGESLYKSVLASGLASEPLDKTLQLAIAIALLRMTPARARRAFG